MKVIPVPCNAAAFAPFGALVTGPAQAGDRRMYTDWLKPVSGLQFQFHVNAVTASALPLIIDRMERHPHAAQVFVPLHVGRYLVTVMPTGAQDQPDPSRALCMVVPGNVGVIYRPGVWHAGMTALDHDAQFAVMMWRGALDDDVFETIPPLAVLDPKTEMTGTRA
jgi:ureidoglycolate lyase